MSKLDELIQELCPNGVEYKRLGEIVEYQRGKSITKKAVIEGDIPVISGGQQPAYYHNESNREGKTITIAGSGAYAGYIMYWEKPIFVSDAFSLKGNEININTKYIYYYLKKIQEKIYYLRKGAGISHVYFKDMQDFLVPVPPLEVQCEIVRILDKFTLLTAELTAELTARRKQYEYYRKYLLETKSDIIKKMDELLLRTEVDEAELIKMRKKQYDYYRDKLFETFEQKKSNNNSSKDDEINEADLEKVVQELYSNGTEYQKIGKFTSFEQPTKYIVKSTKYDDSYEIPVLTAGQTFVLGYTNEKEGIYNASKENPVIIFDDFTGAFKWVDFPFKVKSSAMKIIKTQEDKVLLRFLYYKMGVLNFTSTEHKRLWISKYSQISISIPPLEVQNKIVDVLDRFDKLCNGISDGLPAEIDRRQKQYEYYRDLLLNFKEVDEDE